MAVRPARIPLTLTLHPAALARFAPPDQPDQLLPLTLTLPPPPLTPQPHLRVEWYHDELVYPSPSPLPPQPHLRVEWYYDELVDAIGLHLLHGLLGERVPVAHGDVDLVRVRVGVGVRVGKGEGEG